MDDLAARKAGEIRPNLAALGTPIGPWEKTSGARNPVGEKRGQKPGWGKTGFRPLGKNRVSYEIYSLARNLVFQKNQVS